MLRVGLTGELGSGKSTVAKMLAARGAIVFSSDEMARTMMQDRRRKPDSRNHHHPCRAGSLGRLDPRGAAGGI